MTKRTVETLNGGASFVLDPSLLLGGGTEGEIYGVQAHDSVVIKIYRDKVDDERVNKLKAMLADPPEDRMQRRGHASIAWPRDLVVWPSNREVCGFVMPRLRAGHAISTFSNLKLRRKHLPYFTYQSLCRLGSNLASAVWALHEKRYVIGDINEGNVMATADALVTIVDTDSFQITDRSGHVYRCPVFTELYTPPEFQGVPPDRFDRAPEHDLFGIGVLLFQLLMEGRLPYVPAFSDPSNPIDAVECLSRGYFPYGKNENGISPPPLAPPYSMLHPLLQRLFNQCFVDGHRDPKLRPTAELWRQALHDVEEDLVKCQVNGQHYYFKHLNDCPWCERTRRMNAGKRSENWDPFPQPGSFAGARGQRSGRQRPISQPSPPPRVTPTAPGVSPAPQSPVFTASASSIRPGQPVTFQWNVPNAHTVQLKGRWGRVLSTSYSPAGSATVWPTKNKTYRLSASGVNTVMPPPITISVTQLDPVALKEIGVELSTPIALHSKQLALLGTLTLKQSATPLLSPMRLNDHVQLDGYQPLNDITVDLNYA